MPHLHTLTALDLRGLSPEAVAAVAEQMLARIAAQGKQIAEQAQAIKFKDVKIERITFELARLKAWRFGAKTERMNAEQRQMFEETLAEDQASLEAQLQALQAQDNQTSAPPDEKVKRKPRRQMLPDHLRRVDYHHEPENTTCECGQAMVRIGEDIAEKLDIVPAEFFVHRHIRGKWACKCCQRLAPGSRGATSDRQGDARGGAGGAHAGEPFRRSHPLLPPGRDQCALWRAHAALDAGVLVRRGRRRVAAAV